MNRTPLVALVLALAAVPLAACEGGKVERTVYVDEVHGGTGKKGGSYLDCSSKAGESYRVNLPPNVIDKYRVGDKCPRASSRS